MHLVIKGLRHLGPVLAVLLISLSSIASAAPPSIEGNPAIGWDGQYVVGRWTPVTVTVSVTEAQPVQLTASALDPDGNRVLFHSKEVKLEPGQHRLTTVVKVGRLDGEISVRVNDGKEIRGVPGKSDWLTVPLKPSTRLIATVGKPLGFEWSDENDPAKSNGKSKVATVILEELPSESAAYNTLSALVLAGTIPSLPPEQVSAIKEWVSTGGRLILSLRQDVAAAKEAIATFGQWFPISVADNPATVREFGGLESFAGKSVRVPHQSALAIPSLQSENAEILAASRTDAFMLEAPYGMGSVTVLALDLTTAPLSEWKALPAFCQKLTSLRTVADIQERTAPKSTQLSSTGINDLATQLFAIQDDFASVHRLTPWFVMGLLVGLLILVGPVDYLIVQHLLKRPYSTWVTFPAMLLIVTLLASVLAAKSNGTQTRVNQLDILNYDMESSTAVTRHLTTVYSPTTSQHSIEVHPVSLSKASETKPPSSLSWYGVPESNFGGMLREGGFERGADYEQTLDGGLKGLPTIQWGSKAIEATSVQTASDLVACDLRASTTGRLTGTITHRFATPIEDWMIVYRNVVYRQLKKKDDEHSIPLPPNQLWRVDQPSVYSRELRPFLTGIITIATPRFGESHAIDTSTKHTAYDTLSLDPFYFIRILTFHEQIGGTRYTGLTNQLLEEEDCSTLLRLGRAIVFGRFSQPLADIQLDNSSITADRQNGFVRIVLPVTRSKEVAKQLQRLVDP